MHFFIIIYRQNFLLVYIIAMHRWYFINKKNKKFFTIVWYFINKKNQKILLYIIVSHRWYFFDKKNEKLYDILSTKKIKKFHFISSSPIDDILSTKKMKNFWLFYDILSTKKIKKFLTILWYFINEKNQKISLDIIVSHRWYFIDKKKWKIFDYFMIFYQQKKWKIFDYFINRINKKKQKKTMKTNKKPKTYMMRLNANIFQKPIPSRNHTCCCRCARITWVLLPAQG